MIFGLTFTTNKEEKKNQFTQVESIVAFDVPIH